MYSNPELSASAEQDPSNKVETAATAKLAIALNLIFICLIFCLLSDGVPKYNWANYLISF
jgi:hypothetical protein